MRTAVSRVLLFLVIFSLVSAGTIGTVQGQSSPVFIETDITSDTTWTQEEGPYRIVADVAVRPDVTLTVEPGTTIQVAEGVTLSVAGTMEAIGTESAPITITSPRAVPERGSWGSIASSGSGSVTIAFEHVDLRYATTGITLDNPATDLSVSQSTFTALAADGIHVPNPHGATDLTVSASRFRGLDGHAITAGDEPELDGSVAGWSVTDSTFQAVNDDGVALDASAVSGLTIRGNEFQGIGMAAIRTTSDRITGTTIAQNTVTDAETGVGVETAAIGALTFARNSMTEVTTGVAIAATENVLDLTLTDNRVTGSGTGVEVVHDPAGDGYYSFHATVARNDLSGNDVHGFLLQSGIFAGPSFRVHNNTFAENGWYGARFAVGELQNAAIRDNEFRANGEAGLSVAARHVRSSTVESNLVRGTVGDGLVFEAAREITGLRVADNRILDNAGVGLTVSNTETAEGNYTVADNLVVANAYGLSLAGPQTAIVARNEIVFNTFGFGDPVPVSGIESGVGVIVADGQDNFFLEDNDIYGHRVGLFTDTSGTVRADGNYWGAESGAYHRSINPEGEGDAVVTGSGWVDIIYASERLGAAYTRPTPNLDISPQPVETGESVTVSGAGSTDPDGTVERYRFVIGGTTSLGTDGTRTVTFDETGTYPVELAVEDDLGIESADTATEPIEVVAAAAPTTTTTTQPTTQPTTTTTDGPPGEREERGPIGSLLTIGGLLGGVFFLVALGLGAIGMYQTVADRPLTVSGRRVQILAGVGIAVWALFSVVGPGALLVVSGGALVLWVALTGLAFVVARAT